MEKYYVMPKVVVYKNTFEKKDLDRFYKILNSTNQDVSDFIASDSSLGTTIDFHGEHPKESNDSFPIDSWVPWYTFGVRSTISQKRRPNNLTDEDLVFLYDFRDKLEKKFFMIVKDYVCEWSQVQPWPEWIDSWNVEKNAGQFFLSRFEILKHYNFPDKTLALAFHTDAHEHRDEPKMQPVMTGTIYINDDYEGGEVEFLNELDEIPKLITYKPEAGDITMFPSGVPYWHSAKAVLSGNEKLFLRNFISFDYKGSKKYHDGVARYGESKWKTIYQNDVNEKVFSGIAGRQIFLDGVQIDDHVTGHKIYVDKENYLYVNGKDINK